MDASNRKPRIALLGTGVLGGGSLGQGVPVVANLFKRLSHQYDIVYYSYVPIDTSQIPAAIKVRQPLRWRLPGRMKYLCLTLRGAWDHLFRSFDIIFAVSVYPTGWYALLLRRLIRKPLVVQLIACEAAALPDIGHGNLIVPWLAEITRSVCAQTDELVTISNFQKEVALRSLPTSRTINTLILGIDSTKFPYHQREISSPVQFLHIAYLSPIKDQETMFKTFSIISKSVACRLTVIGDGYDIPRVRQLLETLNIDGLVDFEGAIAQEKIPFYFQRTHILLHTSRFEGSCAVVEEAMTSGVAVCGTAVGMLADVGVRLAVVAAPGDAEALAERTLRLIADPLRYSTLCREARQYVLAYNADWAAENYHRFIGSIISKKSIEK